MIYVDTHCHLGSRHFEDDRDDMVKRMLDKGVSRAVIICCGWHDLLEGVKLRDRHPGFMLACGVHPQDLEDDFGDDRLERLEKVIQEYRPDMIGEIGYDYYSHPHTKERQKRFFAAQLEMASRHGLPVNIHSRKASADTLEMLKRYPCRGIIHSYSGSVEMARLYMKEGYYISFGASMLFPLARRPREAVARVPLDRLLVETDSPFQSPVPHHRHEPADVVRIYEEICRIKGIGMRQLTRAVEENFNTLFTFNNGL